LSLRLKHIVPKAAGTANIVFKAATSKFGTLNNNADRDSCFVVECKVPWAGIGIDPVKGLKFKADFCVNDNDTLIDFRKLPLGPVKNYTNTTMLGYRDFGFPAHWPELILEGEPTLYKRMTDRYAKDWVYFLFFSLACIALAIAVFFFKIKRMNQIPARDAQQPAPLVNFVINPEDHPKQEEQSHPLLLKARSYILNNLDQQIKTEDLASELALSVRQLQRIFQLELNTTPKAFVITVKLEIAAEMLKEPGKNVTEVAYSVGFTDPSYFARVFKKYLNSSPSDFQAK
jgi:AraC-like DNA-binding protein